MQKTILEILEKNNWKVEELSNTSKLTIYQLAIKLENSKVDTFIEISSEHCQLLIYTVCPTNVPENQRLRVSEFITRVNRGLILGNFELDFEDGELRYKSSYVFDDTLPNSEEIFLRNLYATFNAMDKYLPGVFAVVFGNAIPFSVLYQIDKITDPLLN